jgi:hypothetical protein
MESKVFISYEETIEVDDIWAEFFPNELEETFLDRFGLRAEKPCVWFDSKESISLLEIACEKKWFLAKIKYGI